MAKGFTANEKKEIREKLIKEFRDALHHMAIQKISIDDLVNKVGISKGSFYSFYDSKELLFVDVANVVQEEIVQKALIIINDSNLSSKDKFKQTIHSLIESIVQYPWIQKLTSIEYEKVLRRLPDESKESLLQNDIYDVQRILDFIGLTPKVDMEIITTSIQIILYSLISREHFGPNYTDTINYMIDVLVNGMFEGSDV